MLFRAPDGAVAALEDACPHRKLPLSMGRFALAIDRMRISRADLRLRWDMRERASSNAYSTSGAGPQLSH